MTKAMVDLAGMELRHAVLMVTLERILRATPKPHRHCIRKCYLNKTTIASKVGRIP
jgi:hypothetical protein